MIRVELDAEAHRAAVAALMAQAERLDKWILNPGLAGMKHGNGLKWNDTARALNQLGDAPGAVELDAISHQAVMTALNAAQVRIDRSRESGAVHPIAPAAVQAAHSVLRAAMLAWMDEEDARLHAALGEE